MAYLLIMLMSWKKKKTMEDEHIMGFWRALAPHYVDATKSRGTDLKVLQSFRIMAYALSLSAHADTICARQKN